MTHHDRTEDRERFWSSRDKDEYECPRCGRTRDEVEHFQVHHIDENPANGSSENLIALCRQCHWDEHNIDPGKRDGHWSERYYNEWNSDQTPLMYL